MGKGKIFIVACVCMCKNYGEMVDHLLLHCDPILKSKCEVVDRLLCLESHFGEGGTEIVRLEETLSI